MAVGKAAYEAVTDFDDWYLSRDVGRDGELAHRGLAPCAGRLWNRFERYRREHQSRVKNYYKYEIMADAEVVSKKPDLPNVSSGEIAGMVRRTARNIVQNTPNVEVVCEFDDDNPRGILARHVLKSKVIGDDLNSNAMQQHLFTSVVSAFTLGFDAVVPVLAQAADGSWCIEYDTIHYQDVFPEPGVKDVRSAPEVFVRRYLTEGQVAQLIRGQAPGWDITALKAMAQSSPPSRQRESVSHQDQKHHQIPDGYEIITWYSTSGDPFLTFDANSKMLLRIEANKDPLKRHPVFFLVLERDAQQPLGKSQISLVYGRQEFQDLMLNGAMKLWYKNINPTIVGYGTGLNGVPNMSPGKYTNIPNPNAKLEALEVSTLTLQQFGTISQQNMGSMINLVGAADQQMAATAGSGMSATPQGVDAQQTMVDITTNNYQKAVEFFFSQYLSYALTMYFAELKNSAKITPSADARRQLLAAGMDAAAFDETTGQLDVPMREMHTTYHVRVVPGSLVEMEDEKQLRILQEIFVPLSQAMPALAQTGDPTMLQNAAATMQYILAKTIELSGSAHAMDLKSTFTTGRTDEQAGREDAIAALEEGLGGLNDSMAQSQEAMAGAMAAMQDQMKTILETQGVLFEKLGVPMQPSAPVAADSSGAIPAMPVS